MMLSNRELFKQHLAQTTNFPLQLEIDRAEGIYMFDPHGKEYIDLISGISVSNIGHRHPRVIEAIKKQLDRYMHLMVYGELVQSPQVQLAKAITDTLPSPLDQVYLVNSGSEAIEGALKLAKRFTGRAEIISCYNAYHGSTAGALSAGGNEIFKQNYRPLLPGHQHIPYNDVPALEEITENTAAFLAETIQGEAGARTPDEDYFRAVRKRCNETGTLLILDEIQAGFGRTGTFWAFEHYGILPDILTSAKGMGGGMPIGCFISSQEIMQVFTENPILGHITTFGGHPVSAAAALATLHVIHDEELMKSIPLKEQLFRELLKHPKIKSINGKGFLIAAEFESFEILKKVIDKALAIGVLTDWFLFCDNSMRIAPPLTITEEEIRKACRLILQAVDE